jgi:hypothetical protein
VRERPGADDAGLPRAPRLATTGALTAWRRAQRQVNATVAKKSRRSAPAKTADDDRDLKVTQGEVSRR